MSLSKVKAGNMSMGKWKISHLDLEIFVFDRRLKKILLS